MEFSDGGVHRSAVRCRVMRRQWNAEALLIVVAQWTGNEGLDRRKAQGERRTLPRPRFTHGENWEWRGNNGESINL